MLAAPTVRPYALHPLRLAPVTPTLAPGPPSLELARGLGNAVKLFGALLVTWTVGLAMRLYLPRRLGPEAFGALAYAEAVTMVAFLGLGLGLETYIRKEVSVRAAHAIDFFGGTLALRGVLAACAFLVLGVFLHLTGRDLELRLVAYLFGGMQVLVILNATYTALLHSVGRVDGLSVVSIAAKLVWAGWLLVALLGGAPLWVLALAATWSPRRAGRWRSTPSAGATSACASSSKRWRPAWRSSRARPSSSTPSPRRCTPSWTSTCSACSSPTASSATTAPPRHWRA